VSALHFLYGNSFSFTILNFSNIIGVFCENFIDADVKEYSFAKENQIFPLQEDMVPVNRRSKKFSTAMQSALAEQEIIDSVIEVH
jgi:hypothetical protein